MPRLTAVCRLTARVQPDMTWVSAGCVHIAGGFGRLHRHADVRSVPWACRSTLHEPSPGGGASRRPSTPPRSSTLAEDPTPLGWDPAGIGPASPCSSGRRRSRRILDLERRVEATAGRSRLSRFSRSTSEKRRFPSPQGTASFRAPFHAGRLRSGPYENDIWLELRRRQAAPGRARIPAERPWLRSRQACLGQQSGHQSPPALGGWLSARAVLMRPISAPGVGRGGAACPRSGDRRSGGYRAARTWVHRSACCGNTACPARADTARAHPE